MTEIKFQQMAMTPGLYIVSTPIGSARDITLRALDTLASVDVIAAEDTRNTRKLLEIHGVAIGQRALLPYHDHNGAKMRPRLLRELEEGHSVAYVSDAGTPMVADPGFALVRDAAAAGHMVTSVPGASAALAALTVSGLPTDRFFFAGFAPQASGKLASFLDGLKDLDATVIIYEVPRRLERFLKAAEIAFGPDRPAAVCRELTKKFEDVRRQSLAELVASSADMVLKGECVVVIDRAPLAHQLDDAGIREALRAALNSMSFKDAVKSVSSDLGLPKRHVYQLGLDLSDT